jgi:hypothetical protein
MGKKEKLSPEERARWAEIQREHIIRAGGHPQPKPLDPSPLITPETYKLWVEAQEKHPFIHMSQVKP